MSLSYQPIQQVLRSDFVCAWKNSINDPNSGSSFAHPVNSPVPSCVRGNGEHNIQLLILTPRGELLSVLAGYIGPDELLKELRFAQELYERLDASDPLEARKRIVRDAHDGVLRSINIPRRSSHMSEAWQAIADRIRMQRGVADHRYVVKHPLQPIDEFRLTDLVGSARTFFGSSSGSVPSGRLGR